MAQVGIFKNTSSQTLAANESIPFTDIKITSPTFGYVNNEIQIRTPGLYKISANFALTGAAAGTVKINMTQNGTTDASAYAQDTIATAGDLTNLSFSTIVKVSLGMTWNYATIGFTNVAAGTYSLANVIVEKIQ